MKILLISTTMYQLTKSGLTGYGGLEHIVALLAMGLKKMGCEVSVVCPGGSDLGEGIEIISTGLREPEEAAYLRYKNRLESAEFSAIEDHTWLWYSVLAQQEASKQLPIIHCWHTDPYGLGSPPPIAKPCLLAFSNAEAEIITRRWNRMCRVAKHGIDLNFYKPDPSVERGDRYLFLARYTPEKGFLDIAYLTKKCGVGLDAYGDTEIISSPDYANRCFAEADGRLVRVFPGIPREQTVKEYQSHKALITHPNYIEIFGLTTIECMATGTPVLSKDSGAARELIKHGKTGFLYSTLEEAEELIKTDAVSRIKPEDCRKQAEKFSIAKSAKSHLKIMEDVANSYFW